MESGASPRASTADTHGARNLPPLVVVGEVPDDHAAALVDALLVLLEAWGLVWGCLPYPVELVADVGQFGSDDGLGFRARGAADRSGRGGDVAPDATEGPDGPHNGSLAA